MKVSIIGAGSFGTALAILLANKGYDVYAYDRNLDIVNSLKEKRENERYLKGIKIPDNVFPLESFEETVKSGELLVLAVPSHGVLSLIHISEPTRPY